MRNFWIVPGSEENWRQALISKGIWGLKDTPHDKVYWLALAPNDLILFYVSGKVKGVIGYGIIRSKFYQDVPLWKAEIQESRVKWPLRFEFDIKNLLQEIGKLQGYIADMEFSMGMKRLDVVWRRLAESVPTFMRYNPCSGSLR